MFPSNYPSIINPYFTRRPSVHEMDRVDSFAFVPAFIEEFNELAPGVLPNGHVTTEDDAQIIKHYLNTPPTTIFFESLNAIQVSRQEWITFDYVQSNLNNGYIFYFVCNGCDGRVRYLYQRDYARMCWRCQGLKYRGRMKK